MPPKKPYRLGRKTSDAARKQSEREQESPAEKQRRLEVIRVNNANARANETLNERERRLEAVSTVTAQRRANEGDEQRNRRLEVNRAATSHARVNETEEETERRRAVNRAATSHARVNETEEETERRRAVNRAATAHGRMNQTEVVRDRRLEVDRIATAQARAQEDAPHHEMRLEQERERRAEARDIERQNANRLAFQDVHHPVNHADIGDMDRRCPHCAAMKFRGETKGICCGNCKIVIERFPPLPPILHGLITGNDATSRHFLSHIRRYNSSFAMTSFGHREAVVHGWNPNFRIQGQVFHRIGTLHPQGNEPPKFLQVYFLDSYEDAVRVRGRDELNQDVLRNLTVWLHDNNRLIQRLKTAHEALADGNDHEERKIVIREDKRPHGEHARRYNAQTAPEVAILMENDNTENRDIVLRLRDGGLQRISELHPSYDPLQYPLIFPYGTDGYSIYLRARTADGNEGRKVSQLQFYSYHIMVRDNNHILRMRRLFQQYLVDVYCKIETERLGWVVREQATLRADSYASLRDSLFAGDGDPNNVGQRVILPATFTGGPRWMHEKQSDAMAYVRRFGRPDFFITMTTNPKWMEIRDNLLPGQDAHDRPDIIARVFRQKQKKFMELLKLGAFGRMQAFLYTIEYQKRGLPHMHVLLWLAPESKVRPDEIDQVITAEIPDPEQDRELHRLVMAHMIHGPCGPLNPNSPCMKDGKCLKGYPKPFLAHTEQGIDSYPKYRRRNQDEGGNTGVIVMNQFGRRVEQEVSNQWTVPYNPFLLRQFNCHINVEICSSIKSVKYITKYVTKGTDQAVFELQRAEPGNGVIDEVNRFQNARYIGSSEAVWRILEHPISENFPPVVGLAVHLENGQRVYFNADNAIERAQGPPAATTLTAYCDMCRTDALARTLKYQEMPEYFTWNKSTKRWARRKRGEIEERGELTAHKMPAIGRMYSISPRQGDCYFVRLLLTEVIGPTSFDDLRTVDGQQFSFREACLQRGLLENDQHLRLSIQEAGISQPAANLRSLFAVILTSCFPSNPEALWTEFRDLLSEDFLLQHRRNVENPEAGYNDQIYNLALCSLEDTVLLMAGTDLSFYNLPVPDRGVEERLEREYFREIDYDQEQLAVEAADLHHQLTDEQRQVFDGVIRMVNQRERARNVIFLDAPGGTGKSFLINVILKSLRGQGRIALATASSGIAATLLEGGRTFHSMFKVPLDAHTKEKAMCAIKRGSVLARVIRDTALIVVDEAPMTHKSAYEAVDRTLQDITGVEKVMGGIPTLLCGDFRQILPVVKRGTRANIVNASLKASVLWTHVTVMHLTLNMRAYMTGDQLAATYSRLLLNIGSGGIPSEDGTDVISIPRELCKIATTLEELKAAVYPDLVRQFNNHDWLAERAILSPLNANVNRINSLILSEYPGEERVYKSFDSAITEEEAVTYPVELLNTIELSGMPPHLLKLKIGVPIMILRNLEPPKTTNGTRCIVSGLHNNVIEATIACGPYKGDTILLPRIPLVPSDSEIPFQFRRLQFPCKACFSMSVNKAQGQTFREIGVDLSIPCFTHGQLYVAVSRTGCAERLTIMAPNGQTRNVVYPEAL